MRSDNCPLPDYEHPPLVEVILGLQFEPLPKFRNAHLGAFWKLLGSEVWPTVSDAPPLKPQYERFGDSARWSATKFSIELSHDFSNRLQMKNRDGDRMIQIQNGRFHFNWMGRDGGKYPRYLGVRAEFLQSLEEFLRFVEREQLGEFLPNQWEVTYLNHVPQGTVWSNAANLTFFRPLGGVPSVAGLIEGESFEGEWHFQLPEERGRLHVHWRHGLKQGQPQEIIVLSFTARGPIDEGRTDATAILEGLDLGHETIVRSFTHFMSDSANQHWGLKHEDR